VTASVFAQFAMVGVLAVIAGFIIPALLQVRRTARAVEDLVRAVSPGATGSVTHLDAVLGRVDRALESVENGSKSVASACSGVSAFVHGLRWPAGGPAGSAWLTALSGLLAGMAQTWTVVSSKRSDKAAKAQATKDGGQKDV